MRENGRDKAQSAVISKRNNNYDFYQTIKDDDLKFLLEKTNDEARKKWFY